jgi:hypothetical protein
MTDNSSPFRQSALDRLASPEQLDEYVEVTDRRGWLLLAAVFVLLTALGGWSIFGRLDFAVEGDGVLLGGGGLRQVAAPVAGELAALRVRMGEVVTAGQIVAVLRIHPGGGQPEREVTVPSPINGQIVEFAAALGETLAEGTPICSLEPPGIGLTPLLLVPAGEAKRITPGMLVQVAPSTVKPEEFGYMTGTVTSVSQYPATREGLLQALGHAALAEAMLSHGPVLAITVALESAPANLSGYRWTSANGPPVKLSTGTLCHARVIVEHRRPISLLIPQLRALTGTTD